MNQAKKYVIGIILSAVVLAVAATCEELPKAIDGVPYHQQLACKLNGTVTMPLKATVLDHSLPDGLLLSPDGLISGTPRIKNNQEYNFTVTVTDSSQTPQTQQFEYHLQGSTARVQTRYAAGDQNGFDPATFVHIYEDTRPVGHIEIYNPKTSHSKGSHLSTDRDSSLIIIPDSELLKRSDVSLNKLFISAVLASGDKQQKVEVVGYSEIGKDESSTDAQRGMAFQTVDNVEDMVLNMAYTAGDIVMHVADVLQDSTCPPCGEATSSPPGDKSDSKKPKPEISEAIQKIRQVEVEALNFEVQKQTNNALTEPTNVAKLRTAARERFSLYKPEIEAVGSFFANQQNLSIVRILGKEIFWIDSDSLQRIAQQYQENVRTIFDTNATESAQARATHQLLDRTMAVLDDFRDLLLEVKQAKESCSTSENKALTEDDKEKLKQTCAIEKVLKKEKARAFSELAKLFAPGAISLRGAKAADGDLLTVTIEAKGADGATVGIPAVFEIDVKKFGAKVVWGPSLLFVHRNGVTHDEAFPPAPNPPTTSTPTPINRVNFAPSPGVTFGIAYFKRGNTGKDKLLRALGPGIGMNVTFMNFNDPSYNLATNQFVNTTGTNVQVGAGTIGSLFDNKLQFSYGWNLNVDQRRSYVAVGFGFIEMGKELAKYIPK